MTNYTDEQLAVFPWEVSTGTLRPCDLAAAYLSALDRLTFGSGARFLQEHDRAELAALANHAGAAVGPEPTDCALMAIESATELLESLAPAGFYFGSNPGDGADIGFFVTDEWADALERMGMGNDCPNGWASLIRDLEDAGVDADNFDDAYQGQTDGITEERAGANYCQELAEETGMIPDGLAWPLNCIDWDQAWRELRLGDGYWLQDIGGGDWLVFRAV
jgi:hypothetical protein